ncbi:MAG TPA: hypothetical protein VKB94_00595 [Rhizomicrobium sp.]|nr:hypothetical protein [Rhizomicrobium sp.]
MAALPIAARAQTPAAERSNMPPNFYPAPSCEKPDKKRIGGAPGVQDQNAMRAYNYKIKVFNDKAAAFNACIKAYVEGAQNDIDTIQAIVHAAVADANAQ